MIEMDRLALRNHILFDKVEFLFEPGLTFVGGANQSGKSLLFSSLLSGLYPKDKTVDLKLPAGSTFHLDFNVANGETNHHYEYEAKANKSTRYSLFKNGVDQKPHKISDAMDLLRQSFSIPAQVFTSTTYVRALKDHPLIQPGAMKRAEWLYEVLDLITVYDDLHRQVDEKLKSLKEESIKQAVLQEELDEIQLPKMKVTREEFKAAQRTLDRVIEQLDEANAQRIEISNRLTILNTLPDVDGVSKKAYTKAVRLLDQCRRDISTINEQLDAWDAYDEVAAEQAKADKLRKKLEGVKDPLTPKTLKLWYERIASMEKTLGDHASAVRRYQDQADVRTLLESSKNRKIKGTVASLRKKMKEDADRLAYINEHGKSLRELSELGSKCPTCGGKLDSQHVKSELKKLRAEYQEIREREEKRVENIEILEAREIELLPKPKLSFDPEILENVQENVVHLEKLLDIEIENTTPPKQSRADLVSAKIKHKKTMVRCEEIIEIYNQQATVSRFPEDIQELFAKGAEAVRDEIQSCKARAKKLTKQCEDFSYEKDRCQQIVTTYKANKQQYARLAERKAELQDRLTTINGRLKDMEPLKALMMAFGNSGLRLQQLKESADVLSAKMTEFSPLFFDNKNRYVFNMEVAQRKLNLNITRNNLTDTLATMSGSETRFFSLLFGMSLLHLLPNRLRSDTIILDEIDSMLDAEHRERYAKDILPEVCNHVPKTIVVSPLYKGELNVNATRTYRIVKSQKKGHWQSELKRV